MNRLLRLILALALTTTVVAGGASPAAAKPSCCGPSCPAPKKSDPKSCCRMIPTDRKAPVVAVSAPVAHRPSAVAVVPMNRTAGLLASSPAPRAAAVLDAAPCGLSPPAAVPA